MSKGVRMTSHLVKLIACVAVVFCSAPPFIASTAHAQEPKFEMGTFYLCLLVKPSNWAGQTPETQQLFQAHTKHVLSLIASGKASIAGPFGDDTRIAGIFVLNAL